MAKTKNPSPIATRLRSKSVISVEIKKENIQTRKCKVRLVRLTSQQIMSAITKNLVIMHDKTVEDNPSKYNFRSRPKEVPMTQVNKIPKVVSKAVTKMASPNDMTVARLWTYLKKNNSSPPVVNLCCLAKMRSFSPWPATVLNIKGRTAEVYFFGEGTTGSVATAEIVPFENCSILVKKYFKINGYIRAVRQLEITLNIPQHLSLTKDI